MDKIDFLKIFDYHSNHFDGKSSIRLYLQYSGIYQVKEGDVSYSVVGAHFF